MDQTSEYLSREEFFAMPPPPMEEVVVPELNGKKICITGLSANAKGIYQSSLIEMQGTTRKIKLEHSTARLLSLTIVNKSDRKRLFTDADILALGALRSDVMERLAKIANRLSGMDDAENEKILKNFEAAQSDDSPIVSL